MGVRDYEREESYDSRDRMLDDDRMFEREYDRPYDDDRRGRGRRERRRRFEEEEDEPPKKQPLSKREPVRIAGAVATLVTAGALVLFGVEVTSEQQTQIQDLILLAIPVIVPVIASFEVARSKVDSPATVERKLREEHYR